MTANVPIVPIAGASVLRAALALIMLVVHWLKALARAFRHRREARVLAGLDRHMLADIGITQADVRDALSRPFWEDPTALLSERVREQRRHRRRCAPRRQRIVETGFQRPPLDRPARQTI